MPVATIIRDKNRSVHVRISPTKPSTGGDVEVIDVLIGGDVDELRGRAHEFAKGQQGYFPVTQKRR